MSRHDVGARPRRVRRKGDHAHHQDRLGRRLRGGSHRAALELAEKGDIHYLGFECLAERTIALAQQARLADPDGGYDTLLTARMEMVLPACVRRRIRVITNMGAANPEGAAKEVARVARRLGLHGLKIAAVSGDDVLRTLRGGDYPLLERSGTVAGLGDRLVSANAYLGVAPIVEALRGGADIVITGRVADPALFLAPLVHELRLGPGGLGHARQGHRRRPPAGMRRADHRRIFR